MLHIFVPIYVITVFDPKKYGKAGMARVTELVKAKIAVCRG